MSLRASARTRGVPQTPPNPHGRQPVSSTPARGPRSGRPGATHPGVAHGEAAVTRTVRDCDWWRGGEPVVLRPFLTVGSWWVLQMGDAGGWWKRSRVGV